MMRASAFTTAFGVVLMPPTNERPPTTRKPAMASTRMPVARGVFAKERNWASMRDDLSGPSDGRRNGAV